MLHTYTLQLACYFYCRATCYRRLPRSETSASSTCSRNDTFVIGWLLVSHLVYESLGYSSCSLCKALPAWGAISPAPQLVAPLSGAYTLHISLVYLFSQLTLPHPATPVHPLQGCHQVAAPPRSLRPRALCAGLPTQVYSTLASSLEAHRRAWHRVCSSSRHGGQLGSCWLPGGV